MCYVLNIGIILIKLNRAFTTWTFWYLLSCPACKNAWHYQAQESLLFVSIYLFLLQVCCGFNNYSTSSGSLVFPRLITDWFRRNCVKKMNNCKWALLSKGGYSCRATVFHHLCYPATLFCKSNSKITTLMHLHIIVYAICIFCLNAITVNASYLFHFRYWIITVYRSHRCRSTELMVLEPIEISESTSRWRMFLFVDACSLIHNR